MKKKPTARAADPKPCEHCGHCPTCGHSPHEGAKVVPVPMPYPVPAAPPPPVYPWGWRRQPNWISSRSGYGSAVVYRDNCTSIAAQPAGMLMNCN